MKTLEAVRKEISERPPTNDLIEDLLPNSTSAYMLLCGRSGIGKTFLALEILYRLASGTPFLSHKTEQCKVGYLSFEGSDRKIIERFDKISASGKFPDAEAHIYWEHCLPLTLNERGVRELMQIVTGLEVCIIDPMRPLITGDYTSPKDAAMFLKNLRTVQNETACKMILIHHIRKPDRKVKVQPEDLQFEVKGASEYVEAANTVLLLERDNQPRGEYGKFAPASPLKMLHFVKVKDAPTDMIPTKLQFNSETLLFEPVTTDYEGG